jgi:hypothetical protein
VPHFLQLPGPPLPGHLHSQCLHCGRLRQRASTWGQRAEPGQCIPAHEHACTLTRSPDHLPAWLGVAPNLPVRAPVRCARCTLQRPASRPEASHPPMYVCSHAAEPGLSVLLLVSLPWLCVSSTCPAVFALLFPAPYPAGITMPDPARTQCQLTLYMCMPCLQERAYVTGLTAANLVIARLGYGSPATILDVVGVTCKHQYRPTVCNLEPQV